MSASLDPHDPSNNDWLPRLDPAFYNGLAVVFWTFVIAERQIGWLDVAFHCKFREHLLHTCHRYQLVCPAYVLMTDHVHLILMGTAPSANQRKATAFLRRYLKPEPFDWQHQPHDHVLREKDREQGAFQKAVHYTLENPVRKHLSEAPESWQFTGCMVPGYPVLNPFQVKYWEVFWNAYWAARNDNTTP
jgi:putative transposase